MKTIRLEGIGVLEGIEAKDLKVGDVTIWNYGGLEKITSITPSKTGKTLKVGIEYTNFKGEIVQSERKLNANRVVAIQ
jgi:hypothetical protein